MFSSVAFGKGSGYARLREFSYCGEYKDPWLVQRILPPEFWMCERSLK